MLISFINAVLVDSGWEPIISGYLKLEGTEDEKMKILLNDKENATAHEKYKNFNQDDQLRLAYESRQRWIRDYKLQNETS